MALYPSTLQFRRLAIHLVTRLMPDGVLMSAPVCALVSSVHICVHLLACVRYVLLAWCFSMSYLLRYVLCFWASVIGSSLVWISRHTSGRSIALPTGDEDYPFVRACILALASAGMVEDLSVSNLTAAFVNTFCDSDDVLERICIRLAIYLWPAAWLYLRSFRLRPVGSWSSQAAPFFATFRFGNDIWPRLWCWPKN